MRRFSEIQWQVEPRTHQSGFKPLVVKETRRDARAVQASGLVVCTLPLDDTPDIAGNIEQLENANFIAAAPAVFRALLINNAALQHPAGCTCRACRSCYVALVLCGAKDLGRDPLHAQECQCMACFTARMGEL